MTQIKIAWVKFKVNNRSYGKKFSNIWWSIRLKIKKVGQSFPKKSCMVITHERLINKRVTVLPFYNTHPYPENYTHYEINVKDRDLKNSSILYYGFGYTFAFILFLLMIWHDEWSWFDKGFHLLRDFILYLTRLGVALQFFLQALL